MLLVIFGLPAAGKTYVGKILEKEFGFYLHDGDIDLSENMRRTLEESKIVTDQMRDEFFNRLLASIRLLCKTHKNLAVSQTFIKEKYRKQLLAEFPEARFILVDAQNDIREKRLSVRKDFPLDISYARKMVENFDMPEIEHLVILNNEGEEEIKRQLKNLLPH